VFGHGSQELLFLSGVVVVWYFVGRALDRYAKRQVPTRKRVSAAKALLDLTLMVLGMLLLLVGITPIFDKRGFTNPTGATVAAVFWLIWFLVLFFLPGADLVRGFRTKRSKTEDV
jgi:Na+/H+ antiporter NhaD/arsenite permease-like protein